MRISGWLVGFLGFLTLLILTTICSIVSYTTTRQFVIDRQEKNNILLESPIELANALVGNFGSGEAPVFDPSTELIVQIPTITPNAEATNAVLALTPTADAPMQATMAEVASTLMPLPSAEAQLVSEPEIPVWTDPRQLRILLMGIDQRSSTGERGPFRTDTMMLINIDPIRKTVGVISIPRDLWVTIPGFESGRVNTANFLGDANAYPGGGAGLAMETVATNFGIRVDRYLMVNFDVFLAVVDNLAPNGVEVCINESIYDPKYPDTGYGIIEVRFEPGCQLLDAERLLQYARTRATQGGDFDRARRQQRVLDATRAHVLSAGGVLEFAPRLPILWDQLSGSFQTNLTPEEIIQLGGLMTQIDPDNIEFGVIDNLYVDLGVSPKDEQILIPRQAAVSELLNRVLFPQTNLTLADIRARAEQENASIVVYNNTDVTGLASLTREFLASKGVSIDNVGNMPTITNTETTITEYQNAPWTARYMASLLEISFDRIRPGTDGLTSSDIMIVVGEDIQPLLNGE